MILDYNTDPNITPEERIQSLRDNVQLALDEQQMIIDNFSKSLLRAFGADVSKLRNDFTSFSEQMQAVTQALSDSVTQLVDTVGGHTTDISGLDGRLDTLEGKIPAAPAVDGVYKLTVTVTSGVPAYTWELVV